MEAVLAPITLLESLPHAFYNFCKNLIYVIKIFTSEKGYVLIIQKSKSKKVWLKCTLGDLY